MERTTAGVTIAFIVGVTIIGTALIFKWYLIQKVVYEQGYSQVMQPYATQSTAVWVKKGDVK